MEKVYADPKSGYTPGPFPKPWVKITKKYDCPSPLPVVDSAETDSLFRPLDSLKAQPAPGPVVTPTVPDTKISNR
jgi:penicillin-binding protein 1A